MNELENLRSNALDAYRRCVTTMTETGTAQPYQIKQARAEMARRSAEAVKAYADAAEIDSVTALTEIMASA